MTVFRRAWLPGRSFGWLLGWPIGALALAGCGKTEIEPVDDPDAGPPPWTQASSSSGSSKPVPGMAWIPEGVLIAGTRVGAVPRIADEEMPGAQITLRGFYIDIYPHPNEPGSIPTTDVSQAEAANLCTQQGKRLCTELEWERACKGPSNTTYPYGETYREATCQTGRATTLTPAGYHALCVSGFGVHDLHGSIYQWTSSPWGRGSKAETPKRGDSDKKGSLAAIRGGNGEPGDLIARCANARPISSTIRRQDIGFRCCKGEPNAFEVVLDVVRGEALELRPNDFETAERISKLLPPGGFPEGPVAPDTPPSDRSGFVVERVWVWRPLGNEELLLGGGCGYDAGDKRCGLLVVRRDGGSLVPLHFVSTDEWQPTFGTAESSRVLVLQGGDIAGAYRKRVSYDWGRVGVGEKVHKKVPKKKKK